MKLSFFKKEESGGVILIMMAAFALLCANSPLADLYFQLFELHIGPLSILHWINDALMVLFFLFIALKIKLEMIEGQLSTWPQRILPGIAALGGMIVPALIYLKFNPQTPQGWAIPTATDIAFALAVMALLGKRVPMPLKIFLTALAIIDDLGAIIIIAFFYTVALSPLWLGFSGLAASVLWLLNRRGVCHLAPYLCVGTILWFCMLQSGFHATLAGVALGFFIPQKSEKGKTSSLDILQHKLHPWVVFIVLPLFAFANAGVSLEGISVASLFQPVTLGIMAGLFFGKMIGVFVPVFVAIRLKIAQGPENATFTQIFGVSLLCGIGFTMSLFIGLLAFPDGPELQGAVKLGVLAGSFLSAIAGAAVLRFAKSVTVE